MKKCICSVFFMFMLQASVAAHSQPDSLIVGTWVHSATEGYVGTQECPDFIAFSASGSYQIENECAGVDPRRPVVETGKWKSEYTDGSSFLLLSERSNKADHDFLGADSLPRLRLLEINDVRFRMEICAASGKTPACRVDIFRRWSP